MTNRSVVQLAEEELEVQHTQCGIIIDDVLVFPMFPVIIVTNTGLLTCDIGGVIIEHTKTVH